MHTTESADGSASVSVIRGVATYVMGSTTGACITPIRIGPAEYPESLDLTYTPDGCREMSNLTRLGILQTSARGEFAPVHLRVTFPDGTPAYRANVAIISRQGRQPFVSAFLTDRNGALDLPVPLGTESRSTPARLIA